MLARSAPMLPAGNGWLYEPKLDGFRALIHFDNIQAGNCACERCHGRLSDPALSKEGWGFCSICRCAWQVAAPDGHEYAATVPSGLHRLRTSPQILPMADDRHH